MDLHRSLQFCCRAAFYLRNHGDPKRTVPHCRCSSPGTSASTSGGCFSRRPGKRACASFHCKILSGPNLYLPVGSVATRAKHRHLGLHSARQGSGIVGKRHFCRLAERPRCSFGRLWILNRETAAAAFPRSSAVHRTPTVCAFPITANQSHLHWIFPGR